ncbi:uncharacterized protein BYT42DRAFT_562521 [Radiomyces spectabilis]|uniref:uncharacterized protein n=1 Tax=Radiomyces spectabilis TaxID=64574 RepID=UPI00221F3646|nr:uncharacterized protein BYT42DRAFT_562521 [Radiomyces spectabilis]KAI8384428.1 hypothetical protein BYT42DRAFT_562521 [Radiomyces spectabilis]
MAFQFGHQQPLNFTNGNCKRKLEDNDEEEFILKRFNDISARLTSVAQTTPDSNLPSITYASPDYRPPPRTDALWLQPVPTATPAMEEDSTDEDDTQSLMTPSYQNEAFIDRSWTATAMDQ